MTGLDQALRAPGSWNVGAITGVPVIFSPAMKDGEIIIGIDPARGAYTPIICIGTRPLTDLELWSAEIRHQVREGMADVLAWCGQEVGPPPSRTGAGQRVYAALLAKSATPKETT